MNKGPTFILAGNGPYENRGCEAIVRGTVKIVRSQFKNPRFICISHFNDDLQYQRQFLHETDHAIIHLSAKRLNRNEVLSKFWKPSTWIHLYKYFFDTDSLKYWIYKDLDEYLQDTIAVLSIGGDNYAIDFGLPTLFTDLDDIVLEKGKPLIIWGASIGSFNTLPDYERYMSSHLSRVSGIFARESTTREYLGRIGVTKNVFAVADPAFLIDPVKPVGIDEIMPIEDEAIGLNISALMAKYVTGGNLNQWTRIAASLIRDIAKNFEIPLYLIPHVSIPNSNDYEFMQHAVSLIPEKLSNLNLVPAYNAEEMKWIIGQMTLFAGSRTHATIASLSSGVPTLSIAYSMKARGINRDIFGHEKFIISPNRESYLTFVDSLYLIFENENVIKNELNEKIPEMKKMAWDAGSYLKELTSEN